MARRRGITTNIHNTSSAINDTDEDAKQPFQSSWGQQSNAGTKGTRTMPLTQEKRLDSNFSNNNDQNYLHKKFKKMASTISLSPSSTSKDNETAIKDTHIIKIDSNTSISHGSIAASHPEIEKIKDRPDYNTVTYREAERNVQTTFNDNNVRLSDVNNFDQISGKTSFSNEFSNKTENLDNDFSKDVQNGTNGRYVCPYCKLSCAKPSVLQKHIRAHTNERPYPCVPCGFAFKTKSNLYKHRRSRTHALRLQGADVSVTNEDELSAGSESDTSLPATSASDAGSDASAARAEPARPSESSSPDLASDRGTPPTTGYPLSTDNAKFKTIYKPKFRAAFYQDTDDKEKYKKNFSHNADFLNEHISKIISDNEAIVDVIETPLQKKYGKIKQIAESKQLHQISESNDVKFEPSPLNLTKTASDSESSFRKRSHSETFSQIDFQKHPLNPEGSIIKDLLLKTKINGLSPVTNEMIDGLAPLYVCPLCQIPYRSADNLEIHRMYYCKGSSNISSQKEVKGRPENVFMRSNSVNVRLPETPTNSSTRNSTPTRSPPLRNNKPDNLVIVKPECNDVMPPLPSPGPLLGNTRLVDTRVSSDFSRRSDIKSAASPKRRIDSRSDTSSPRMLDNMSPRSTDSYAYNKMRCLEQNHVTLRSIEDLQQMNMKSNSSLQMFGGEVKIVDRSGSTTTLRIEPSKNQLSPVLFQQNLSPTKHVSDAEASIVVRSGLHSGGTIVHNPPTPKNIMSTSHVQTPRITIQTTAPSLQSANMSNMHDMPHFQFPPLSAITAFNPLTLPPLSPSTSSGTTSILHAGKIIPHVPGIPGPNTPAVYVQSSMQTKNVPHNEIHISPLDTTDSKHGNLLLKYEIIRNMRSPNQRVSQIDVDKYNSNANSGGHSMNFDRKPILPLIKVKNVDEAPSQPPKITTNTTKPNNLRNEGPVKRSFDGVPRTPTFKETANHAPTKSRSGDKLPYNKSLEIKTPEQEIRNFNFENLITKAEIYNNQIPSSSEVQKNADMQDTPTSLNERSETSYFQKNVNVKTSTDERKPKFLRPSTLPLKPGTFTPKKHHGITPNANTMPLVSPETPRPSKAYGQLYLNGNAYTYLGLKCSTKVFYCTINRPQPTYVPNQHFLSMYSNWQLFSEMTPDPLGLSTSSAMSLYDSRHRPQGTVVAKIKQDFILTHSSQWMKHSKDSKLALQSLESKRQEENKLQSDGTLAPKKELAGGFESNEEYTYIRGRGRGRYVCSECGIRCKKPSMLKKHIRTHTDVRPYTCTHCQFSFKTKGNLTKHMKSKAHYKKCCELGVSPGEGADGDSGDAAPGSGEEDDETDSDGDEGNEGETESSDTEACKSRLPEHEAAACLLSLGASRPAPARGLLSSARPSTYPYSPASEPPPEPSHEPMDLSRTIDPPRTPAPIPTARESSVLACLASNTAKLPQPTAHWSNGEPMLHAYLTERALLDTKIKQSQFTSTLCKRKTESDKPQFVEEKKVSTFVSCSTATTVKEDSFPVTTASVSKANVEVPKTATTSNNAINPIPKEEVKAPVVSTTESAVPQTSSTGNTSTSSVHSEIKKNRSEGNAENAKFVVSEYLKHSRVNSNTENTQPQNEFPRESNAKNPGNTPSESQNDEAKGEDIGVKMPVMDHDPVARKVVIGAGGVAFKVTKGKEFDNMGSYSPGRLMEDGRRVCDFCNKSFTKPSQLRLHLNIHYMERPFRCGACAVSFRTRGHLQKHERSGSHHNKVSMTTTFGAATSLNPRPFRCSDCNIAFRIHGHLAKHLRSKMHVMRLECLFKLPFGTFTEIERAGVSLTDIDTTDCASSLASLQVLARKLHDMDPSRLEYRSPPPGAPPPPDDSDDGAASDTPSDTALRTTQNCDSFDKETRVIYSATDN
ncbi:uncharacterized protein LOC105389308 isoform X1 [Plutella xylostella]|uniref:uncharacterized protein LOC105389308 isoform X1 n=2 Tax=Plutella xylostella TaxID=51655 RepID=UPI0020331537|nr:uncharacterized protein LOC105389308 isoform X1 [Plutella xylostella]